MTLDYLRRPSLIASVSLYAGLGNRMRTILGAQSLAELETRYFAYCWPTGRRFGPALDELWRVDAQRVAQISARALALHYPFRNGTLGWLDDAARAERVWQIRTGQPLTLPTSAIPWTERLRELRPAPVISNRVEAFYDQHLRNHRYVGVMIRAHEVSHALTRQHSPVEWFVTRMREIMAREPDIRFFVSCDVPSVQGQITTMFPNAVGLTEKGTYNSREGITSAVVDLYLLASAAHLLGPHFSSFPELALHLAGDQLVLETSMTAPDLVWEHRRPTKVADPTRPSVRA